MLTRCKNDNGVVFLLQTWENRPWRVQRQWCRRRPTSG